MGGLLFKVSVLSLSRLVEMLSDIDNCPLVFIPLLLMVVVVLMMRVLVVTCVAWMVSMGIVSLFKSSTGGVPVTIKWGPNSVIISSVLLTFIFNLECGKVKSMSVFRINPS